MALPVVVQVAAAVNSAGLAYVEVTMPGPVTAGNTLVLVMAASTAISTRTYTITDTLGGGGWTTSLYYNPDRGGGVWHRHNCPAGTPTIRITQSASTFATATIYAVEVSGLVDTPPATGTYTEPSVRSAHTCSSVALTGTDVFAVCFMGLTANAGAFAAYGAGYAAGFGSLNKMGQHKAVASLNDAGPWTTSGTQRAGNGGMVVFQSTFPAPTTMQRVQGTGKARLPRNTPGALSFSFASLPVVGNAVVVTVAVADSNLVAMTFANGMVTDNQGNVYTLQVAQQVPLSTHIATAIYACPKVVTSSGTFTLQIAFGNETPHGIVVAAAEVGGLGANSLLLETTQGSVQNPASGIASSGNTSMSITGERVIVGAMVRGGTQAASSIVAQALSPAWVQEAEELDASIYVGAEGVSRIVNMAGVAAANWNHAPNATSAAVLAVFKAAQPTVMSVYDRTFKVRVGPVAALTLELYPEVGHGVVVQVLGYRSAGMTFGAMTDSAGHTYTLVTSRRITTNGEYAVGIFFLPRVLAIGQSPWLITLAGVAGDYYTAHATAYALAGGQLAVAASVNNSGSGTSASTTATAALTGEHVLASSLVRFQTGTSIEALVVDPPWVEELEELDGANWVAGEADQRIMVASGTQVNLWTLTPTGNFAAALAAFRRDDVVVSSSPNQMGTII